MSKFPFPSWQPAYMYHHLLLSCLVGVIGGLEGSDDLYEFHDWHWVHEMHADDLSGSLGGISKLRD